MQSKFGLPLIGVGSLLVMVGLICVVWAPGQVKRTPLNVDSVTVLDGTVQKLNTSTGELEENPVRVVSVTKTDSEVSDGDVVVFQSYSCAMIDDGNLPSVPNCLQYDDPRAITAPEPTFFAADRRSAEAVDGAGYLPDDVPAVSGLQNKWPFDAEKKDYKYWDGTTMAEADAVFDRTETVDGLEVYVYKVDIVAAPIEVAEGVPGTYDDAKEIWVEPKTGSVVDQRETQVRTLDDGTVALDLSIGFTEDQVSSNVKDAKTNISSLNLITKWVPILGFVIGAALLAAGAYFMWGHSSSGGARRALGGSPSDDFDDFDDDDDDDDDAEDKPSLSKS